jgi:hypothetical protein
MNGSFRREGGACEIYRKWTCGRESSEGIGLEPAGSKLTSEKGEARRDEAFARMQQQLERRYLGIQQGTSRTVVSQNSQHGTSCEDSCRHRRAQELLLIEDWVYFLLTASVIIVAMI